MADGLGRTKAPAPELVVDLFAGLGGASTGLARAYREPDIAVNHNAVAIAVHRANHPTTRHYTCDVFEIDPLEATGGRPVGVLWASPDCRHHSRAKGGKPRDNKVRGLAWVIVKWAKACKPRIIHLENVCEFIDWCPLLANGTPSKRQKGKTFLEWKKQLQQLGYMVEHRELIAADYDTPTIRKRLYVIARCDGEAIVWPEATHHRTGANHLPVWRSAAECIDFELPSPSIFDRKKPLAVNTQRRIAKGLWRYVLNSAAPFIVPLRGTSPAHTSTHPVAAPLSTVTGGGTHHALVQPHRLPLPAHTVLDVASTLIQTGYGERVGQQPRALDLAKPLGTVVAGGVKHALASAHLLRLPVRSTDTATTQAVFLEQANGGYYEGDGRSVTQPVSTIMQAGSQQRLVSAFLVKYYRDGGQWQGLPEPMHTIPTKARMGLVAALQLPADTLTPEQWVRAKHCADLLRTYLPEHFTDEAEVVVMGDSILVDITLRMLIPRELSRAQGFADDFIIDRGLFDDPATGELVWRAVTKTDQVRLIGNSVCWRVAHALAAANTAVLRPPLLELAA